MKYKSLLLAITILFGTLNSIAQIAGSFKDSRDGKVYKTVKIGTQTWMAENLAYKLNFGCWAYNNDTNNVRIYGYLYDWETAKKVCPYGWHLPTDEEWSTLSKYLGDINADALKSTTNWNCPNSIATNRSNFTALPGGLHDIDGRFEGIGVAGFWWRYPTHNADPAGTRTINCYGNSLTRESNPRYANTYGFSIRCVKD
jgi:uncharacterized protein (TIGR02145 family)